MKVILLKNINKLGHKYETVTVKDGYARNYLVPNNYAVYATKGNIKHYEELRKKHLLKVKKENEITQELIDKIKEIKQIETKAKASKEGKLYASIKEEDIIKILKQQYDIVIPKKIISFEEDHIKTIGKHKVSIKLKETLCNINLEVLPKK